MNLKRRLLPVPSLIMQIFAKTGQSLFKAITNKKTNELRKVLKLRYS